MRRLLEIIKYGTDHISLVANINLLTLMPALALQSLLSTVNSSKSISLITNFMGDFKKDLMMNDNNKYNSFQIFTSNQIQLAADWISEIKYEILINKNS